MFLIPVVQLITPNGYFWLRMIFDNLLLYMDFLFYGDEFYRWLMTFRLMEINIKGEGEE